MSNFVEVRPDKWINLDLIIKISRSSTVVHVDFIGQQLTESIYFDSEDEARAFTTKLSAIERSSYHDVGDV